MSKAIEIEIVAETEEELEKKISRCYKYLCENVAPESGFSGLIDEPRLRVRTPFGEGQKWVIWTKNDVIDRRICAVVIVECEHAATILRLIS